MLVDSGNHTEVVDENAQGGLAIEEVMRLFWDELRGTWSKMQTDLIDLLVTH